MNLGYFILTIFAISVIGYFGSVALHRKKTRKRIKEEMDSRMDKVADVRSGSFIEILEPTCHTFGIVTDVDVLHITIDYYRDPGEKTQWKMDKNGQIMNYVKFYNTKEEKIKVLTQVLDYMSKHIKDMEHNVKLVKDERDEYVELWNQLTNNK